MACTCNKNNSTSKNRCNSCNDSGCLNFVYPKCILTETAYPCIGVGAGKTGTVLFAAIDSAICALKNTKTVVEGCIQSINGTDYPSIVVTPTVVGSTTTYKVCLSDDFINFLVSVSHDLQTINNEIHDISGCVFDVTGGCEIDNLKIQITNIDNEIVTINNDIVTINNELVDINNNITTLESCVLDASGNCLADEVWKTIGGGGTFLNGEVVPNFNSIDIVNSPGLQTTQVRKLKDGQIQMRGALVISNFDANVPIKLLFTLPIGYIPLVGQVFDIFIKHDSLSEYILGQLSIATTGEVYLSTSDAAPWFTIPGLYTVDIYINVIFDVV